MTLDLPANAFALVVMNHVIEHMPFPLNAIERVHRLLAPGGRAVVIFPNPKSFGATFFGSNWFPWEAPRHLVLPDMDAFARSSMGQGWARIQTFTVCRNAPGYLAVSRHYAAGGTGNPPEGTRGVVSQLLAVLERMLVTLGFPVGEEAVLIFHKPPPSS